MSVLLLGKPQDQYFDRALRWLEDKGEKVTVARGKRSDPLPEFAKKWTGDWIISYLSPWVVPAEVLQNAKQKAINFHPGPPEYPGIGCTNFAIYNEERVFGVTSHLMLPKVDTGKILGVRRFDILRNDSVFALTQRCYENIWVLFEQVMTEVLSGKTPTSSETWKRKAYKRTELNALCELTPEMTEQEMNRRIRAVTFPGYPGAYLRIGNRTYDLVEKAPAVSIAKKVA